MASKKIVTEKNNTGMKCVQNRINAFYADYPCSRVSDAAWTESLEAAQRYESTLVGGRKPSAIAAAIVYFVGLRFSLGYTQSSLAYYYGVTEVSLRNNLFFLKIKGIV